MRYWLGPWQWITDGSVPGPSWNAPSGTIAVVDLRPNPSAGLQGTFGDHPIGFFAGRDDLSLPSEYELIGSGDCREISATTQQRNAWQSLIGYRPDGDRLVDLLWDNLTNGSDPEAIESVGPLTPNSSGVARLLLSGHSVVKSEVFGDRIQRPGRWNAVLTAQFRNQFRRYFERNQEVAEKILGNWVAKYKLGQNWRHLVPPGLRQHTHGPRRPTTSYSDVISGRTEALNAGNWHYYTTSQNFQVVTAGTYLASGSGYRPAEYISSLSSDDMYSEFEWVATIASSGPATRTNDWNTTTPDFMHTQQYSGQGYITKIINGGATNLANAANTHSIGNVDRLTSDGSDHVLAVNSVDKVSVTDTSISGYVQAGFMFAVAAGAAQCKNWACSDIVAEITVSVGQSSETDSALSVSISRTVSVGIASESNSSLSASPSRVVSVGIASESDSGLSVGHSATVQCGIATESNSALQVSPIRSVATGFGSETDSALSVSASRSVSIGIATESNSSGAVTPNRSVSVGLATENDSANQTAIFKSVSVGQASESDSSLAILPVRLIQIGIATENDSAFSVSSLKTVSIGQSSESNVSLSVTPVRSVSIGIASESDSANDISSVIPDQVGQSQESDSALPVSIRRTIAIGIATETDSSFSATVVRSISIGIASETNSGLMSGIARIIRLGLATENDSALAIENIPDSTPGAVSSQIQDRLYRDSSSSDQLSMNLTNSDRQYRTLTIGDQLENNSSAGDTVYRESSAAEA